MANKKSSKEITIRSSAAEYLTFVSAIGDQPQSVELRYEDENIWLTQRLMAELYGVDVRTINDHIQKVYNDHELEEEATIRNFRIVQTEGTRQVIKPVPQTMGHHRLFLHSGHGNSPDYIYPNLR